MEALKTAGVQVAKSSAELVELIGRILKEEENHLEESDLKKPELVSISKPKLESMKRQIREITLKSGITVLIDGKPYLLGYPLSELIASAPIEDIVSMIIRKEDPKVKDRKLLKRLFSYHIKNLPLSTIAVEAAVESARQGNPLNASVSAGLLCQRDVPVENLHEDLKDAYSIKQAEAIVLIGWIFSLIGHIRSRQFRVEGSGRLENIFFKAVTGRKPSLDEADIFRGIFAACADHTPAVPSSLAALTSYSGGVSLKTALAAGITAMGDTHAGAGEGAAYAFQIEAEKESPDRSIEEKALWLVNSYAGKFGGPKRRIPGYGHRYYGLYGTDPRTQALFSLAEKYGYGGKHIALAKAVERILQEEKAPGLCLNLDGAIGAIISEMGIPPSAGKALFIIPRSAGILGQLLEQSEASFFRLNNESIKYMGPDAPRKYSAK
jgi:citrate synthase